MPTRQITQSESRLASELVDAVLTRGQLSKVLFEREELISAAVSPVSTGTQKAIFTKYAEEKAREAQGLMETLSDPNLVPKNVLVMLPTLPEFKDSEIRDYRRKEAAIAELAALSLDQRIDTWSQSQLVSTVSANRDVSRGVLSGLLGDPSTPEELREAIHAFIIVREREERQMLLHIRAGVQLSEISGEIFDRLVCASFNSQRKLVKNAIGDTRISIGYRYRLQGELAKLKDEHDAYHKDDEKTTDTDALILELVDKRTSKLRRLEIVQRVLGDVRAHLINEIAEQRGPMLVPIPIPVGNENLRRDKEPDPN